jgi:hypothetical protein
MDCQSCSAMVENVKASPPPLGPGERMILYCRDCGRTFVADAGGLRQPTEHEKMLLAEAQSIQDQLHRAEKAGLN